MSSIRGNECLKRSLNDAGRSAISYAHRIHGATHSDADNNASGGHELQRPLNIDCIRDRSYNAELSGGGLPELQLIIYVNQTCRTSAVSARDFEQRFFTICALHVTECAGLRLEDDA